MANLAMKYETMMDKDEKMMGELSALRWALSAPWKQLAELGTEHGTSDADHYIHVDRGSNVLGIAHADSVQVWNDEWGMNEGYIQAPTLDNRLGLWTLLFYLPSIGVVTDLLITDNEEGGGSTASEFSAPKEYNWCISFDRGGYDVVTYHHNAKKWDHLLAGYGFTVGMGSYSDISSLPLPIFGMNVGCGMSNYHATNAQANLRTLRTNAERVRKFYRDFRDVPLPSVTPRPRYKYTSTYYGYVGGQEYRYYKGRLVEEEEEGRTTTRYGKRTVTGWHTTCVLCDKVKQGKDVEWWHNVGYVCGPCAEEWEGVLDTGGQYVGGSHVIR